MSAPSKARWRAWLTAAAVLVGGGASLAVALRQAGQGINADCEEWGKLVAEFQAEPTMPWFVALIDGYIPPEATADRTLGTCAGGQCAHQPQGCGTAYAYEFQRSGSVGGWRLYRFEGPPYFAKAWRDLAASAPASVRFYRSYKDVGADCLQHFTAAQCRNLLAGAGVCWKRGANQWCRDNGRLYGPGLGGVNADGSAATCTPQAGDVPYPCGDGGRGADWPERANGEAYGDEP